MTYIVVSENEIVKAEMERPNENNYYRIDGAGIKFIDKDAYYRDRDLFTCHLASLPRIPAPGHKWKLWDEVVEGKDFYLMDTDKWYWCKCEKCGWEGSSQLCKGGDAIGDTGDYNDALCPECMSNDLDGDTDNAPEAYTGIVAIPIQPTQNKIVKEDMICPETGKYCDDECCTVGSICNVSGSTDGISPQPTPEGEKVEEDYRKSIEGNYVFDSGKWRATYAGDILLIHKRELLNNDNPQTK